MIDDEQLNQALDRIARSADGELLYRYCQKTLMGTLAEHIPADGALWTEHGRRRFAAELMAKMAKGIAESGGQRRNSDSSAERTVVFAARQPGASSRRVGIREHLLEHDLELQRIQQLRGE